MSMGDDLCKRWGSGLRNAISHARDLADHASIFGAISKAARLVLQSGMLALGAFLVIDADMSPGGMIASSIILARALTPIDQVIAYCAARRPPGRPSSRLRALSATLPKARAAAARHAAPEPRLSVRDVAIVPPGGAVATVAGVSFEIEAGDALGIIGPSGCGKSTLVRALVGAWPTARGEVRFDNALIAQYSPETLADAIGHLPQSIELFDGTIAENIARFRKDATAEQVIEAAKMAGVHDMILAFPLGYDTPVGEGGTTLSGGQRQRIGLARALFGNPFLVVLDEPNSNLDPLGEQSLNDAIQQHAPGGQDRRHRRSSAERHLRRQQDPVGPQRPRRDVRPEEAGSCRPVPPHRPAAQGSPGREHAVGSPIVTRPSRHGRVRRRRDGHQPGCNPGPASERRRELARRELAHRAEPTDAPA